MRLINVIYLNFIPQLIEIDLEGQSLPPTPEITLLTFTVSSAEPIIVLVTSSNDAQNKKAKEKKKKKK